MEKIKYDDKITRYFLYATLVWGAVGMLVGVVIATQLVEWRFNFGLEWLSFGRLRPLHTNAIIFAFSANAIFGGVYYSSQRLLKTRMFSDILSKIHFWGWQLIIVGAAVTLVLGISTGKEYAELEWPLDIAVALVWVAFGVNFFGAIIKRRESHIYVAIWFYVASIITVGVLHIANSMEIPVSFWKSYPVYAGVQDALVQWWYGHNAVGFLFTTPFLGIMYYFVPKAAQRPVYSYKLSVIHFWALVFTYIWAGPHHLHFTALPDWAQSLGMVFSLMLWVPSWGGMLNGLLTLRGAWDKLRTDTILKFFVVAITFYGMSTFEGPLLSIKAVNSLSHYTDWTIGHVHSGTLGWVGFLVFGMIYYLLPKLWKRELYSQKLASAHFWIATLGIVLYVVPLWMAGITQGLMWKEFNSEGLLAYPNFMQTVNSLVPLYVLRLLGGVMYLTGFLLMLFNCFKTMKNKEKLADEEATVAPLEWHGKPAGHGILESKPMILALVALVVILIGSLVELIPTFLIKSNVPTIDSVKPYTPLELTGRDIYLREGCYNCHSQMIRPFRDETARYGDYSRAGEFVYDHPFQWGSRRIGPDLHRVGGRFPDIWHYRHMVDPRSTSPGSLMPDYAFMAKRQINFKTLPAKISVMQKLGVPYSKAQAEGAMASAKAQSKRIADGLAKEGITNADQTEITAIIAYMQRLGTDLKKKE